MLAFMSLIASNPFGASSAGVPLGDPIPKAASLCSRRALGPPRTSSERVELRPGRQDAVVADLNVTLPRFWAGPDGVVLRKEQAGAYPQVYPFGQLRRDLPRGPGYKSGPWETEGSRVMIV